MWNTVQNEQVLSQSLKWKVVVDQMNNIWFPLPQFIWNIYLFPFKCKVVWRTWAGKAVKYKIYVYDTKLAEVNDNLIHSHACTFSNYQCVFDHLTYAIMIANLRVFGNVVLTIRSISQVLIQNNFVSEKRYCRWLNTLQTGQPFKSNTPVPGHFQAFKL
jgi:hypothetical protein